MDAMSVSCHHDEFGSSSSEDRSIYTEDEVARINIEVLFYRLFPT